MLVKWYRADPYHGFVWVAHILKWVILLWYISD